MNGNMNYQNNNFQNYNMGGTPFTPQIPTKKKNIGGLIKKLVIFVLIFLALFFGKRYIDGITVDYKAVVDESLSKYYLTGDINDLKEIKSLVSKYSNNRKILRNIQNYVYEVVGDWFVYIDGKYNCQNDQLNSCLVQLQEFKVVKEKLEALYKVKSAGNSLILKAGYEDLSNQATIKIESLTAVSKNRNYHNPDNSETIYQRTCSNATDCDCRDGICTCHYEVVIGKEKTMKDIKCYKPETIQQK